MRISSTGQTLLWAIRLYQLSISTGTLQREPISTADRQSALAEAYCHEWGKITSSDIIVEAMKQSRLVAAFAYAVSLFPWDDHEKLRHPGNVKGLTSMVRRMNREANELSTRVELCRN